MTCNTDAFKLTGAARYEKQQECEATALANFNKANGVLEKDVASGDDKRKNEQLFNAVKEQTTNKGVANAIMDAEKAGVSAAETREQLKKHIELSMGTENVTDVEVEKRIDEGADETVMDTIDKCTSGFDQTGANRTTFLKHLTRCADEGRDVFTKVK